MSLNQLLDQGVIYNGIPGNNAGGKAYANLVINNLSLQGSLQYSNLAVSVTTSPYNITASNVLSGLLNVSGSGAVLNFASGFALSLLTALGGAVSATVPSNLNVLVGQGAHLQIINGTAASLTFTTADANTTLADASMIVPAHGSRIIYLVFTALASPSLVVY